MTGAAIPFPTRPETPQVTQNRASDPAVSAWVSASAGTGKTRVLTDRVLRLLLQDVAPRRLLCLTFTKAAAAEMAVRIGRTLAGWAIAGEATLDADLVRLGERPDGALRDRARRLFARVLDTPGGLPIQTIHAFCQSVLRRFPLEAGISPHFELIEDRTAVERIRAARDRVLGSSNPDLRAAVAALARTVDEGGLAGLVQTVISTRARLQDFFTGLPPGRAVRDVVADAVGIDGATTGDGVLAAATADAAFDGPALRRAAAALQAGGVGDRDRAMTLTTFLEAAPADRPPLLDAYARAFLTAEGDVRKRLATKAVETRDPGTVDTLIEEAVRLGRVRDRLIRVAMVDRTTALLIFGLALLDAYERDKRARGALDYNDLVLRTAELLDRPGMADWVLFKLDGGIDHVLVDEAQDTNADQWRVIAALTAEFVAGEGTRPPGRTLFAVGDEKQSIFSFQGADPLAFDRMRRRVAARLAGGPAPLRDVSMTVSFRSTEAVLDLVDAVFADAGARAGVVADPEAPIRHIAHRRGQAGLVELWPSIGPDAASPRPPWAVPEDQRVAVSPSARLAARIAGTIAGWLQTGATLDSRRRPIRAGDVLVLVRKRDTFFVELVRALKQKGVPVAGVDRMVIAGQLAALDLVAVAETCLLPDDDLTLATVLKGPLVGFDEETLFALAHGRDHLSLWGALHARADDGDAGCATTATWLRGWRAAAGRLPPHEFLSGLLHAPSPADPRSGRRALLARLGPDAADPIDELLTLALTYERSAAPSLQGFVHWLAGDDTEVKRELESGARDQVRIMTVHAAKGLQAPIVFLAGTVSKPEKVSALLWADDPADPPLWAPKKADRDPAFTARRLRVEAQRDAEYRRLLYVALTRAEDRLYICGHHGRNGVPAGCWDALCAAGMDALADVETADGPDGITVRRYRSVQHRPVAPEAERAAPPAPPPPAWLARPPPPEPMPPQPLAPSRPDDAEPAVRSPLDAPPDRRFRRGLLLHGLLQRLPDLPAADRPAWALRHLARSVPDPDTRAALIAEALAVLDHPDLGPAFGSGSQAEVPIVGVVAGRAVAGQVDRLAVLADQVIVIDYKTNRPPPLNEAEVPAAYWRQMSLYRAALRAIHPDRRIRCALVWTDGPRVMQLSDAGLDRWTPA